MMKISDFIPPAFKGNKVTINTGRNLSYTEQPILPEATGMAGGPSITDMTVQTIVGTKRVLNSKGLQPSWTYQPDGSLPFGFTEEKSTDVF